MSTDTIEDVNEVTLTALDRCDAKCPAAARVILTINDTEILLCGHHYAKSETTLASLGAQVNDQRHIDIKKHSTTVI